jgi:hypothetical protein
MRVGGAVGKKGGRSGSLQTDRIKPTCKELAAQSSQPCSNPKEWWSNSFGEAAILEREVIRLGDNRANHGTRARSYV